MRCLSLLLLSGASHAWITHTAPRGTAPPARRGRRRRDLRPRHVAFDPSSTAEWDAFYSENDVFEWHASVSLERLASYVREPRSRVLMVGCGNSLLPRAVLQQCPDPQIVLLDTSPHCLEQLQRVYGSSIAEYKCGDATQLSTLWNKDHDSVDEDPPRFDVILDKGLTDAILCGEGWDGTLKTLFREAAQVMPPGARYLLISYKLPTSTKEFLTQECGDNIGLDWRFDLPEDSNARVSVSVAYKR